MTQERRFTAAEMTKLAQSESAKWGFSPTFFALCQAARDAEVVERLRDLPLVIAADLFKSGSGELASHLRLHDASGRYLGGWCERAVADRIETHLTRAAAEAAAKEAK